MLSPVVVSVLLWSMVIYKLECSVSRVDQSRNAVEYLLQKYYNPLRKLSANLPGHAIELEIDIRGTFPTKGPPKRYTRARRARNSKPVSRSLDKEDLQDFLATKYPGEERATPQTTTTYPSPPVSPYNPAILITPDQVPIMDPAKIPVFMDDLKKALSELEMKFATTPITIIPQIQSRMEPQNEPARNGPAENGPAQNGRSNKLEALMQILRKAVQIERRGPKPGDNLEWVQLKIPKTMQS